MSNTIGVFVPQDTDALFHFHFTKCYLSHLVTVYNDRNTFVDSKHNKKLVCLQMPYPMTADFPPLVLDLVNHCDQVLVLMSELHDSTVEFVTTNDNSKISYFICGHFNFEVEHSPLHKFYDWFTTSSHFYKHVRPNLLENSLRPYESKPFYFDALLGRKKLPRDVAYARLNREVNIVTYLNSMHSCDFSNKDKWQWESGGLVIENPVNWTVDRVNYHGYNMSLSQIIPLDIYNRTVYSFVSETQWSNHYSFFTEKTVKPILGKRLFVMLNGQYSLKNLRSLGFKTFNGIIDESYDEERGDIERFNAALDQVDYLQTQKQEDIIEKLIPICDYNYSHMMRTNWYETYFMPEFVKYFINQ